MFLSNVYALSADPPSSIRSPFYYIINLISGFSFLLIIVHFVVFIYILIGTIKHKRSILWPIIAFIFPLNIIILIAYLALRSEEGAEYSEEGILGQGAKRAYFFIFSFITLGVLFWGVADLIRVILEYNWTGAEVGRSYIRYSPDSFTRSVALRLASVIVALPIWFFHWYNLSEHFPKSEETADFKITFKTFKNYLYLISGLTLAIVLVFGIWFVYQGLAFFLGASNITVGSFAAPVGYTTVALVAFIYHFSVLRGSKLKNLEAQVASIMVSQKKEPSSNIDKVTESKGETKFCSKCGTKNTKEANYCISCGTRL